MAPHESLEDDGSCSGDIQTAIIVSSIIGICLLFLMTISIVSIKRIYTLKNPLPTPIKLLFYLSMLLSILCVFGFLSKFITCPIHILYNMPWYIPIIFDQISIITYQLFACTLLAILILRIHFSFQNSMFAMTRYQRCIFITIYIMIITSMIVISTLTTIKALFGYSDIFTLIIIGVAVIMEASLYFIASIYAIMVFTNNLIKVTTLRRQTSASIGYGAAGRNTPTPTPTDSTPPSHIIPKNGCSPSVPSHFRSKSVPTHITSSNGTAKFPQPPTRFAARSVDMDSHSQSPNIHDDDEMKPNFTETKIMQQVLRYVSLLSLATFTTMLVVIQWLLTFAFMTEHNRTFMVTILNICTVFDCTVNLTCLYLQHTFARKYYNKCCKCMECIWICLLDGKLRPKSFYKEPNGLSPISISIKIDKLQVATTASKDNDEESEVSTMHVHKQDCQRAHGNEFNVNLNALMSDNDDLTDVEIDELNIELKKLAEARNETAAVQYVD